MQSPIFERQLASYVANFIFVFKMHVYSSFGLFKFMRLLFFLMLLKFLSLIFEGLNEIGISISRAFVFSICLWSSNLVKFIDQI
jgi:hypothetical protein